MGSTMAAIVSGGVSQDVCSALSILCRDVVCGEKGILVTDESSKGMSFLFQIIDLPNEEEFRRLYRQLLFWTENLESYFTAAFITEEAFFQSDDEAEVFPDLLMKKGILVGVRMDRDGGCGLDGLRERIEGFKDRGASMVRWRGVFRFGIDPTVQAADMARFAAVAQSLALLPVLAVDVPADGDHPLKTAARQLQLSLAALIRALHVMHVSLPGLALAVPLLRPGHASGSLPHPETSAAATLNVLSSTLPAAVGGVLFTSAGFSEEAATSLLNAIANLKGRASPWTIGFAFSRAQQMSAVKSWEGKLTKVHKGQEELLSRARKNCSALLGLYDSLSTQPSSISSMDTFISHYYF